MICVGVLGTAGASPIPRHREFWGRLDGRLWGGSSPHSSWATPCGYPASADEHHDQSELAGLLRRLMVVCPATGRATDTGFELSGVPLASGGSKCSSIASSAGKITSGGWRTPSSVEALRPAAAARFTPPGQNPPRGHPDLPRPGAGLLAGIVASRQGLRQRRWSSVPKSPLARPAGQLPKAEGRG